MVGSLKLVGEGKWRAADLGAALEARDRAACGPVAPARGLYLVRVDLRSKEREVAAQTCGEADALFQHAQHAGRSWPRFRMRPVAAMTL